MKEFCIHTTDEPGALSAICEVLARGAINIEAIKTERIGEGRGTIHIVTNDEASTESILRQNHVRFEIREILPLKLPDRSGELVKVAKKLHLSGINVDSVYILGKENGHTTVAIAPSKMEDAQLVLKNYM